jgi:hypothetical protein
MLQKMFCFKQRLYNSTKKNTVALKPHITLHFPSMIVLYGCIKNFDTAVVEFMHKDNAKLPYKRASKRSDTFLDEMASRIDQVQLTKFLVDRFSRDDNPRTLNQGMTITYTTDPPENVTFEAMKSSYYRFKLDYQRNTDTVFSRFYNNISPHITLNSIWSLVSQLEYDATRTIVEGIKAGHKGI